MRFTEGKLNGRGVKLKEKLISLLCNQVKCTLWLQWEGMYYPLGWERSKKPDVVGKDKNSYTLLVGK